eukprot:jgi/Tetstr1/424301/TSEL_014869.t1
MAQCRTKHSAPLACTTKPSCKPGNRISPRRLQLSRRCSRSTFGSRTFTSLRCAASGTDCTASTEVEKPGKLGFQGVHHIALIVEDLQRALDFYCGILGLSVNPARPHDKLPYDGAWLWIGPEMIHLMALPNPDPMEGRPAHGGRDRHFCVGVASVAAIISELETADVPYTASKSGRPAIFFRDPDMNTIECVEVDPWRPGI